MQNMLEVLALRLSSYGILANTSREVPDTATGVRTYDESSVQKIPDAFTNLRLTGRDDD